MKKYIQPSIKVKEIELEAILAASGETPSKELQNDEQITNGATEVLSKEAPSYSAWDE